MKFIIILSLLASCAFLNIRENIGQTSISYILGPLPKMVKRKEIIKQLSRKAKSNKWGNLRVFLITPASIHYNTFWVRNELTFAEQESKYNQELKLLVNDKTCFGLTLRTTNPTAAFFRHWYGYILDGSDKKIPVKIMPTTDEILGHVFGETSQIGTIESYATACTSEKPIDILKEFTLILAPQYEKGLTPIRFTWEHPSPPVRK